MMKIEAVTVSVDYSDWFQHCVENNDKLDRWVVVTVADDKSTQKICKENNIECVVSERVFDDAWFAKGKAINDGIKTLDRDAWLLHMDGDISLPANFREIVEEHCKDKTLLYGSVRYDEKGQKMRGQRLGVVYMNSVGGELRRELHRFDIPIGYFQMWHSSMRTEYEEKSTTGKADDWGFAMQFRPKKVKSLSDYMKNYYILPLKLVDKSGYQGHYKQHWYGLRNLGRVKSRDWPEGKTDPEE